AAAAATKSETTETATKVCVCRLQGQSFTREFVRKGEEHLRHGDSREGRPGTAHLRFIAVSAYAYRALVGRQPLQSDKGDDQHEATCLLGDDGCGLPRARRVHRRGACGEPAWHAARTREEAGHLDLV